MTPAMLLSTIIFLPTVGAIILALGFNKKRRRAHAGISHWWSPSRPSSSRSFCSRISRYDVAGIQPVTEGGVGIKIPWIADWNINYQLGYDGISLPLVLLTSFICMLAMLASWSIKKQVKGYLILFLILETGMLGVFLALDFFLFYVFWEVMLLPMYFLIGVWGGPRKEYAAIKFFLYTLAGGVLMLIAILMFYFEQQSAAHRQHVRHHRAVADRPGIGGEGAPFSPTIQITAFILLFIGFAIKVPTVPVPHVVARCARRGPDADQHDPGRRAA